MSEVKLAAETRSEFGKGAARRIRRENKVPVVLYGHGTDPKHLTLPGHDLLLALRTPNVLISLTIDGKGSELAIPKSVQRDPLKGFLEHVDLLLVNKGEKVAVEIPVVTEGELAPGAGLVELVQAALSVEAEATNIPESVVVSIEGLESGANVLAKDVKLPKGVSLAGDEEAVVLSVVAPQVEESEEAAEEAPEGDVVDEG
ncbi:50S ribosomal protein L25/general stress protein Ctc [Streptomyces sp. NPDC002644]